MNPVHAPPPDFFKLFINIILHLRLGLTNCLFPSRFATKILYAFILFPKRATCLAVLIIIGYVTRVIFVRITYHEDPYHTDSSSLVFLPPS
jgi:hypothetical protein